MDRPKIALEAIIILGTGTFGLQWFNGGGALAWEVEVGHSRQAGDSLRYTVSKYLWRVCQKLVNNCQHWQNLPAETSWL